LFGLCVQAINETPQSKLTAEQKSILGSSILATLESVSVPSTRGAPLDVIQLTVRHFKKLISLLDVLHKTPLPASTALFQTLTNIATATSQFLEFDNLRIRHLAWNVLSKVMELDFDVIVPFMGQLVPKLDSPNAEFLSVFVAQRFKLRDGAEFVKDWIGWLNTAEKNGELRKKEIRGEYFLPWTGLILEFPRRLRGIYLRHKFWNYLN
jgi:hypothetical protein